MSSRRWRRETACSRNGLAQNLAEPTRARASRDTTTSTSLRLTSFRHRISVNLPSLDCLLTAFFLATVLLVSLSTGVEASYIQRRLGIAVYSSVYAIEDTD